MTPTYEIKQEIGTLTSAPADRETKVMKKVAIIDWNNRGNRLDIRAYSTSTPPKLYKGISLTKSEVVKLKEILNTMDISEIAD